MATLGTLPSAWDSRSSKRLILALRASGTLVASSMLLICAGGRWLRSPTGGSCFLLGNVLKWKFYLLYTFWNRANNEETQYDDIDLV